MKKVLCSQIEFTLTRNLKKDILKTFLEYFL